MNYLIVENGIIQNIIVADEAFAEFVGALPSYEGAAIGAAYDPPHDPTVWDELDAAYREGVNAV